MKYTFINSITRKLANSRSHEYVCDAAAVLWVFLFLQIYAFYLWLIFAPTAVGSNLQVNRVIPDSFHAFCSLSLSLAPLHYYSAKQKGFISLSLSIYAHLIDSSARDALYPPHFRSPYYEEKSIIIKTPRNRLFTPSQVLLVFVADHDARAQWNTNHIFWYRTSSKCCAQELSTLYIYILERVEREERLIASASEAAAMDNRREICIWYIIQLPFSCAHIYIRIQCVLKHTQTCCHAKSYS